MFNFGICLAIDFKCLSNPYQCLMKKSDPYELMKKSNPYEMMKKSKFNRKIFILTVRKIGFRNNWLERPVSTLRNGA